MRTKLTWIFGSLLAASIAVAACSSDDDDNKNGNPGGTGGTGGQSADGGDNDDGGNTIITGACTNDSDKAASRAGYCPDNRSVSQIVSTCAKGCLFSEEESCTGDCVEEDLDGALSAECRDCYIALTVCGRDNCVSVCASDPSTNECITCLCGGENNKKKVDCYAAFNDCSGLETTYCEDVANGTFTGYPEPDPPAECGEGDAGTDGDTDTDADPS